jgi:hypothetical protein
VPNDTSRLETTANYQAGLDSSETTAEVSAAGPCDGFGDRDRRGAYVEIRIETALSEQRLRISLGAAEVLLAELQGVLANVVR